MFDAIYPVFRGEQTPIFLVTGCAMEIRKIAISSSNLCWRSLSTRDVGRFIGLLLETVRNRFSLCD